MPMHQNLSSEQSIRAAVEKYCGRAVELDRTVHLIEQIGGHEWTGDVSIFTGGGATILAWVAEGATQPRNVVVLYGPHSYVLSIVTAVLKNSGTGD